MFQFGNLANHRLNKGECREKNKEERGGKERKERKSDTFFSSVPSKVSAPNAVLLLCYLKSK
jgi:hypothetical protein